MLQLLLVAGDGARSPRKPLGSPLAYTRQGHMSEFAWGIAGAFAMYVLVFRGSRIRLVVERPNQNWRMLIWDLGMYLLAGGLFATAMFDSEVPARASFFAGASWEAALFSGVRSLQQELDS